MSKASKSSKPKQKIKAHNIILPILAVFVGIGIFAGVKIAANRRLVKVAAVTGAADEASMYSDMAEDNNYYGKLQKGSVVSVKVSNELKIDSVKVKKGDNVKKGDLLVSYDVHSLEDSVADAELLVKTLTNDMTILDNELDILRRIQPSENAPQPVEDEEPSDGSDEPETNDTPAFRYDKIITSKSKPLSGDGSMDDPFTFYAGADTVVSRSYLSSLADKDSPLYAVFYVCSPDGTQLYSRLVDGSKIGENAADFSVSDGVNITPDGMIAFTGGTVDYAAFITATSAQITGGEGLPDGAELYFPDEIPDEVVTEAPAQSDAPYELSLNDNYLYTAQQIKDMIAEREKQKASLELQKKQAELTARKANYLSQTGGETAAIDGTVTFVAKDIYHLSESGAYITITNSSGMSVTSTVGEFSLDKIEVGMKADITNYSTGAATSGTVTYISDRPEESDLLNSDSGNSDLESMYQFTVELVENMELDEDTVVEIKLVPEGKEDSFFLPAPLVRTESGRYYVMAVGSSGTLEKRYITVGSNDAGATEVLDGLTKDDLIAFPYGKAVEGAAVRETSFEDMYYDFGLFY